MLTRTTIFLLLSLLSSQARTWISADDRKIDAHLVAANTEEVILNRAGKKFRLPLTDLSSADQNYLADLRTLHADNGGTGPIRGLFGVPLIAGQRIEAEAPLSKETTTLLSKNKVPPTGLKIALHLPKNFDPSKPQKVLWPTGGLNHDREWKAGNIANLNRYSPPALERGWIVITADTNQGNPAEVKAFNHPGIKAFYLEVIAELTGVWPNFKRWRHAACGFSGGSKVSCYTICTLRAAKANVVGQFLGGCNFSLAPQAMDMAGIKPADLAKVKLFYSAGKDDDFLNPTSALHVINSSKESGYKHIREEWYDGAHTLNYTEFAKALDWFAED